MASLTKQFPDGGNLYIEYSSRGDDNISITADVNESIDREVKITFSADGCESITRTVVQEGMREIFFASDGDFTLSDGGTFNVIKEEYYV